MIEFLRPTEKIVLDRERLMVFDMNTLCRLESVLGTSVLQLLADMRGDFAAMAEAAKSGDTTARIPITVTQMRALVWATLAEDDPKLTVEDAGRLVHFGNFQLFAAAVGRLMKRFFPEPTVEEDASPLAQGEAAIVSQA